MFKKNSNEPESRENDEENEIQTKDEPENEQSSTPRGDHVTAARSCSYVGPKMHIKGEVIVDESLNIDGKVEGTIRSNDKQLAVGRDGHVTAEIYASSVEARGKIDGEVQSEDVVHLYGTAVVRGTIRCERLIVDDGAKFDGHLCMTGESEAPQKGKLTLASSNSKTRSKANAAS